MKKNHSIPVNEALLKQLVDDLNVIQEAIVEETVDVKIDTEK